MEPTEPPSTVPQLLAKLVATRGSHEAIMTNRETVTYAELDRRSAKLARALLAAGAGKGTRLALLAPDSVFWMVTFLAGLRIGAMVTTVSTLSTPPEVAHILRNSDAQILIAARRFMRHDYAQTLITALPGLADAAENLQIAAAPFLRSVWFDDAAGLLWARPVDELVARADAPGAPDAALLAAIEQQVVPSDEGVVVYTSGSTAMPKAVVHTHWNMTRHPPELSRVFTLVPEDRMMPLLPAFWLAGMAMGMMILCTGATLVFPDSPEMDDVLDAITQFKVNRINYFGDKAAKLKEAGTARGIDVGAMLMPGPMKDKDGVPIPPQLQALTFGMTETFSCHSAEPLNVRMPDEKAGAAGRGLNGYERRVVNPETGEIVAPGELGEMQVRGGALMKGFYKVDRNKVFTKDGFYPTGDLARLDADGYSYFVGRRGDMIKTKGANVSRLEVEAAMRALPEVDLPLVVGLPDAEIGQMVAAAVVPKPGTAPKEEALREALRATLSSFKVPRRICFISHDDVPRTATGKLKLHELAAVVASRIGVPT
jgi:acyl-CoA synthetase (AMP-forming)/AMP-acid ligase II